VGKKESFIRRLEFGSASYPVGELPAERRPRSFFGHPLGFELRLTRNDNYVHEMAHAGRLMRDPRT
jgi:hypothetical protein